MFSLLDTQFIDFLRFNFGRGRYGDLASYYYQTGFTASTMPTIALPNLGLADSYYDAPVGTSALVPSMVPFDPATTLHFSVRGYQARCRVLSRHWSLP